MLPSLWGFRKSFQILFFLYKKALKIIFTNRIQKSGFRLKCNVKWQENWASTFNILLRCTITKNFHVVKFNSSVLLFQYLFIYIYVVFSVIPIKNKNEKNGFTYHSYAVESYNLNLVFTYLLSSIFPYLNT